MKFSEQEKAIINYMIESISLTKEILEMKLKRDEDILIFQYSTIIAYYDEKIRFINKSIGIKQV